MLRGDESRTGKAHKQPKGLFSYDPSKILLSQFERRRAPIPGEVDFGLPALTADLQQAKTTAVVPAEAFRFAAFDPRPVETNAKLTSLAQELAGAPELVLLHAYLVAHLRKRAQPALVRDLFLRLWKEESDYLLETLTPRWILSAVISFSVCGENEAQRIAGASYNMFFSLLKLYESERLYSGFRPDRAFALDTRVKASLSVGMTPFSLAAGDLDVNTLAQLYEIGSRDEVIAPPCLYLVQKIMDETGTVFARLNSMKPES